MKELPPDPKIYQGVSVYYGVAKCHGCGEKEAFDGELVGDQYKPFPAEQQRYVEWRAEHMKHRDPDAPDES